LDLWVGNSLLALAAAVAAAEPRLAAVLLGAAETELQGARLPPAEAAVHEQAATTSREALGAAAFEESLEEGRLLTREATVELALRSSESPAPEHTARLGSDTRLP
jgi:hypothetical protein